MGLSAVSNWRKRFKDFPRPVESIPGGRDLFNLREIEHWLERRGRLDRTGRSKQLLFQAADLLRSQFSANSTLEVLGAILALVALGRRRADLPEGRWEAGAMLESVTASDPDLEDVFLPLRGIDPDSADNALGLVREIEEADLPDCFEWLLTRTDRQHALAGTSSSEFQTELLLALAGGEEGLIYDPAAGWGGFLIALWQAAAGAGLQVVGQEINEASARVARQRFLVHGIPVSLAVGDTLLDDEWQELRADIVVCNPPFGLEKSWPADIDDDPRWALGLPPTRTDLAWLQHAVHHLKEDGRAYVFLPLGSLFRGGPEGNLRGKLLAEGAVEAVISLPPRTLLNTGLPVSLWVLRQPHISGARDSVLLIDATVIAPEGRLAASGSTTPRIAAILRDWRQQGEVPEGDRDFAASVLVSELVREDAIIVPARWVHRDLTEAQREDQENDFDTNLSGMRELRRMLGAEFELARPDGRSSAKWVSVKQLLGNGQAEIVRGVNLKKENYAAEGLPVLRARDFSARLGDTTTEPSCLAIDPTRQQPALTRPGDVVLSPASGSLRALVDRQGGHVLVRPLQALRLLDGSIDPDVVAAFLESPRNRRFVTGSSYARVSLKDLELPVLTEADSGVLAESLVGLSDQERLAEDLISSARRLRNTLVSLASPRGGEGDRDG